MSDSGLRYRIEITKIGQLTSEVAHHRSVTHNNASEVVLRERRHSFLSPVDWVAPQLNRFPKTHKPVQPYSFPNAGRKHQLPVGISMKDRRKFFGQNWILFRPKNWGDQRDRRIGGGDLRLGRNAFRNLNRDPVFTSSRLAQPN